MYLSALGIGSLGNTILCMPRVVLARHKRGNLLVDLLVQ